MASNPIVYLLRYQACRGSQWRPKLYLSLGWVRQCFLEQRRRADCRLKRQYLRRSRLIRTLQQQSGPAARPVWRSQQVYHANNLQRQSVRRHDKFGWGLWPVSRHAHAFPKPYVAFAEPYAALPKPYAGSTGCEGLRR